MRCMKLNALSADTAHPLLMILSHDEAEMNTGIRCGSPQFHPGLMILNIYGPFRLIFTMILSSSCRNFDRSFLEKGFGPLVIIPCSLRS